MLDQIERELIIDAPPEEVWSVVTLSGWLADDVQLDLVPGGDASFRGEGWSKQGWIEETVAPRGEDPSGGTLVFWWNADGEPASRVELTLEPEAEGRTRVRVVESRPLETLDVVGTPLPGSGGAIYGPAMLVAA